MSVAIRAITRLVDADDVNVTPAVGVDEYALCWDNDTARFVLRAPFAGILATGATTGATSQAQAFTLGVVSPFDAPAADSTTAWQVRKADKTTAVVTVDTTNVRVGIGTTAPGNKLDVVGGAINSGRGASSDPTNAANNSALQVFANTSNLAATFYNNYGNRAVYIEPDTGGPSNAAAFWFGWNGINVQQLRLGGRSSGTGILIMDSGASVGIKTDTPGSTLQINGNVAVGYTASTAAPTGGLLVSGNVGIGTTSPATALHVVGAATITGGIRPAADSTTALQLKNAAGTSVLNVDTTNGRVGIGTTSPATRFDIDAGALTMAEMTAPTGVANKGTLYTKDNGSGKTALCVKLGDDVEIVLATQA